MADGERSERPVGKSHKCVRTHLSSSVTPKTAIAQLKGNVISL